MQSLYNGASGRGESKNMMRVIEHRGVMPRDNLAFDDTLLESREEVIRFWESPVYFVVLGRSGRVEAEVDVSACDREGVPILRRSSGGGTVLQGPGCLNFTLVLSLKRRPELENVSQSYCVLLTRIANRLPGPGLTVAGSDILLGGRKVSGNAQRR